MGTEFFIAVGVFPAAVQLLALQVSMQIGEHSSIYILDITLG